MIWFQNQIRRYVLKIHLLAPGQVRLSLSSNLDVNGSVTIDAGTLDVSASNYSINVARYWTNNLAAANFVERLGTVTFDGASGGDLMTDETFYTLALNRYTEDYLDLEIAAFRTINILNDLNIQQGTMEVNMFGVIDVADDILISSGGGLNANDGNIYIYCSGDFTDQNASFDYYIGYNAGSSCVMTFDGDANQYLTTAAPQEQFHHLVINKTGSFRSYDNIKVTGDFDLQIGNWSDAVTSLHHFFPGNFTVLTGANFYGSSGNTVHFISSLNQTISFDPVLCGDYFYNVVVDKSITSDSGMSANEEGQVKDKLFTDDTRANLVTLATNIIALTSGNLTIQYGTLDLNGHYFRAVGDVKIYSGGKLAIDADALLEVGDSDSLIVYSGGILEAAGISGHEAKIIGHND